MDRLLDNIVWERKLVCSLCGLESKEGSEHPMFECSCCKIRLIIEVDGEANACPVCRHDMHLLILAEDLCPECLEGELIQEQVCDCPVDGCHSRVFMRGIREHLDDHWREGRFK